MWIRLFYLTACGIFIGGIIHILIILLIPQLSTRDAAKQVVQSTQLNEFQLVENEQKIKIADLDLFFDMAICRFDLSSNALRISGDDNDDFWSASVFDGDGNIIYSLNERTAIGNKLKLLLVNSIQLADLRQTQPIELETDIIVEVPVNNGFFLLRSLVREPTLKNTVKSFIDSAVCAPYETR